MREGEGESVWQGVMSREGGKEGKRKWENRGREERRGFRCSLFIEWWSTTGPFEGWNESWVVTKHTERNKTPLSSPSPPLWAVTQLYFSGKMNDFEAWMRGSFDGGASSLTFLSFFSFFLNGSFLFSQAAASTSEVRAETGLPPARLWHSSLCIVGS